MNFHNGTQTLPENTRGNFKGLVGAGDLKADHEVLDVQYYEDVDVFICAPWDHGALFENVKYLIEDNSMKDKFICFLNIENDDQVQLFSNLFANQFQEIKYHGRCPIFRREVVENIFVRHGRYAIDFIIHIIIHIIKL